MSTTLSGHTAEGGTCLQEEPPHESSEVSPAAGSFNARDQELSLQGTVTGGLQHSG